jgi:hypothetical protein
MEKRAVSDDELVAGLRNEEADLMSKMARVMGAPEKRGSAEYSELDARLQTVRAKITEIDLGEKDN